MGLLSGLAKLAAIGVAEHLGHAVASKSEMKAQTKLANAEAKLANAEAKRIETENSKIATLKGLKELYDDGAISQKEYNKAKKKLLKK